MKAKIIAIVGPSGSGKDTMAEFIKEQFGIPTIVSYTTRPMRNGETDGCEHIFVGDDDIPSKECMLAYTKYGGYHYWAEHKQVPSNGICTYVIDEKGLLMLTEKFDDMYDIIPILIKRDSTKLEANIDRSRTNRDKYRVVLDKEWYKFIIDNNGTIEDFQKEITKTINKLLNIQ